MGVFKTTTRVKDHQLGVGLSYEKKLRIQSRCCFMAHHQSVRKYFINHIKHQLTRRNGPLNKRLQMLLLQIDSLVRFSTVIGQEENRIIPGESDYDTHSFTGALPFCATLPSKSARVHDHLQLPVISKRSIKGVA